MDFFFAERIASRSPAGSRPRSSGRKSGLLWLVSVRFGSLGGAEDNAFNFQSIPPLSSLSLEAGNAAGPSVLRLGTLRTEVMPGFALPGFPGVGWGETVAQGGLRHRDSRWTGHRKAEAGRELPGGCGAQGRGPGSLIPGSAEGFVCVACCYF